MFQLFRQPYRSVRAQYDQMPVEGPGCTSVLTLVRGRTTIRLACTLVPRHRLTHLAAIDAQGTTVAEWDDNCNTDNARSTVGRDSSATGGL